MTGPQVLEFFENEVQDCTLYGYAAEAALKELATVWDTEVTTKAVKIADIQRVIDALEVTMEGLAE